MRLCDAVLLSDLDQLLQRPKTADVYVPVRRWTPTTADARKFVERELERVRRTGRMDSDGKWHSEGPLILTHEAVDRLVEQVAVYFKAHGSMPRLELESR